MHTSASAVMMTCLSCCGESHGSEMIRFPYPLTAAALHTRRFAFPKDLSMIEQYLSAPPLSVARVTLGAPSSATLTKFGPTPIQPRGLSGPAATVELERTQQHRDLLTLLQSKVLEGEGTSAESGERLLTVVQSPVALLRRAVPDDGAVGCLLNNLGGCKSIPSLYRVQPRLHYSHTHTHTHIHTHT